MTGALIVYMLLQPVFGALSDRIGHAGNNMISVRRPRDDLHRSLVQRAGQVQVSSAYMALALVLGALVIKASFYTTRSAAW